MKQLRIVLGSGEGGVKRFQLEIEDWNIAGTSSLACLEMHFEGELCRPWASEGVQWVLPVYGA